MIKKIVQYLLLLCMPLSVWAHDIPDDLINYILDNPSAGWKDVVSFSQDLEWDLIDEYPLETALQLPSTEDSTNILFENPDMSLAKYRAVMNADPVLKDFETQDVRDFVLNYWEEQANNPLKLERSYSLVGFIYLGVLHIVGGLDHVLFVISLLLLLPRFKSLLSSLTVFTVAHSLTFLLAGASIVSLQSHITEPLIAVSIILVAVWSLFQPIGKEGSAWVGLGVIFFFGLFHGLGFAGVFETYIPEKSDLLKGLIGFNVGVEIGQFAIVLFGYPVLFWLYKSRYKNWIKNVFTLGLVVVGILWFVERVFL